MAEAWASMQHRSLYFRKLRFSNILPLFVILMHIVAFFIRINFCWRMFTLPSEVRDDVFKRNFRVTEIFEV